MNILHAQVLPDAVLHHTDHGLRHPQALYAVSFLRVTAAFVAVLDALDNVRCTELTEYGGPVFNTAPVLTAQVELLEAILAHIDDCYHILKALHPPVAMKTPPRFAERWLAEARHPTVKAFGQAVARFREETLAPIVTRVKHEHGRIRSVVLYGPNLLLPGYYLEGVDAKGALGPDLLVHPGNTALSYHRDLRYRLTSVYVIGE